MWMRMWEVLVLFGFSGGLSAGLDAFDGQSLMLRLGGLCLAAFLSLLAGRHRERLTGLTYREWNTWTGSASFFVAFAVCILTLPRVSPALADGWIDLFLLSIVMYYAAARKVTARS